MKRFFQVTALVTILALGVAPAFADTLILKNGQRIDGYYEGGTARVIKFRADDGAVRDYDLLTIQQIQFGNDMASTRAASADPRLVPGGERPASRPVSGNAANTAWTIPTGSKVVIRMIDSISSEKSIAGETFIAVLDEPIILSGLEIVPAGSDVRGRITNVNEAGRVAGSAELRLELTQVVVNGIPYSVTTSEYQEVAEGRGGQTARRAGAGAAIGAIIGGIAGGGKGAAVGAGVGAGGATAVQVMTKGDKLNIPSETKLEFTLRAPLVIAGN